MQLKLQFCSKIQDYISQETIVIKFIDKISKIQAARISLHSFAYELILFQASWHIVPICQSMYIAACLHMQGGE